MSVHGDDDLYADLYGNDDYAAVEDEILGTKSTSAEKSDTAPAETTQPPSTSSTKADKIDTPSQVNSTAASKPTEFIPEPPRAVAQPPPQVGSSIATYTSDEGTTLPPTGYNSGYGSLPNAMRPYDQEAEKQPSYGNPSTNDYSEETSGGSPAGGYNNQQKQDGYANGAVYESSNQGGIQRGAFNNFNAGAQGGGRRFDSVRPSEMKDEGKMFVGGLNWDTTDESLRNYFSEFGKVDACTIMRDASGRSRGFAFLTFEDPAAVNAVMVREHYLDGKIIDPKRAIPRTEHARTQKLFVGGLASTVTSESMKNFFAQYGKVIDANVMVDRDSSRSKGFGFITFEDQEGVDRLLQLGPLELDGKLMDIKLAQPRGAYQRGDGFNQAGNEGGYNNNSNFNRQQQQGGGTPFDPQAMAALYARVQMINQNQGGMGMGMGMGMSNGGMGGMGMGGNMGGMGGYNGGMMGGNMGGNMGGGMGGNMGGMGHNRGHAGMMAGVPRGPAAMRGGMGQGQGGQGGTGPNRYNTKGQHNYRPY